MLSKIAAFLVSLYFNKNGENEKYREVYQYALFIILNYVAFFGFSLLLGTLLGIPFQSIVFFISTALLRRYAGGYHADTEIRCTCISVIYFSAGIILVKAIHDGFFQFKFLHVIFTFFCALVTVLLCPCDTPQKPLEKPLMKKMKFKCFIALTIFILLILFSGLIGKQSLSSPFIVSILTETVLLIAGKIKNHLKNGSNIHI